MNILFLSRWFPFPADNGSKLRIYNILRGLSRHHNVTLLSFGDHAVMNTEPALVHRFCSDIHVISWRDFNPNSWRAKLGLLNAKPRSIIDTFSPAMAEKITELINTRHYDLVIASQLSMAAYYPYFKHVPALFEELEIGLFLEDLQQTSCWTKRLRQSLTQLKLRGYLIELLDAFQMVTVASNQERELVQQKFPNIKNVVVIPNCLSLDDYEGIHVESKPNTLIFTGSFRYHVNYEAMQWFVSKVFPFVLEKIPSAELVITGDHANLPLPSNKNLTLSGYVDDIKSLIASSSVALAPLWNGGGTRLKILEAMAVGTPMVATSKGAEGLDAVPGKHLFVSDDPQQFAKYVICLLQDTQIHNFISQNALGFVRENNDWRAMMPLFLNLVDRTSGK